MAADAAKTCGATQPGGITVALVKRQRRPPPTWYLAVAALLIAAGVALTVWDAIATESGATALLFGIKAGTLGGGALGGGAALVVGWVFERARAKS